MATVSSHDRSTQCVLGLPDVSSSQAEITQLLALHSNDVAAPPGKGRGRTGRGRSRQCRQPAVKASPAPSSSAAQDPVDSTQMLPISRPRLTLPSRLTLVDRATDTCQDGREPMKRAFKRPASEGATRILTASSFRVEDDSGLVFDNTLTTLTCSVGTSTVPEVDHNSNACDGEEDDEGHEEGDQNTNAKRKAHKKTRATARRPAVRKTVSSRSAATRLVNFSALKPINARCSKSGLGLVVTYRPVFSETVVKRRAKRMPRAASQPASARLNAQAALPQRNSGTNRRSPSPAKQGNLAASPRPPSPKAQANAATKRRSPSPGKQVETNKSESFFKKIKAFTRMNKDIATLEENPKDWKADIPKSADPLVKKHRSPSPLRGRKGSGERFRYKVANYSARSSPTPGPSWAPGDLTRSRSRSRSPAYHSSARHRRPPAAKRARSPRSPRSPPSRYMLAPPKTKPRYRAAHKMTEVSANEPGSPKRRRGRGRRMASPSPDSFASPSPSPPPSRPAVSEGWKVTRSPPRGRKEAEGEGSKGRGRGRHAQRDQATSVSRTRHHVVQGSRSSTRSPFSTPSFRSYESRQSPDYDDYGRPYRGARRHARRHRAESESPPPTTEAPKSGFNNCQVM